MAKPPCRSKPLRTHIFILKEGIPVLWATESLCCSK
uniref:Uncharacterized protein n=1 Tax=Arundo donax TaxID=35708 RepID=A0A0A9FXF5_ARUDO